MAAGPEADLIGDAAPREAKRGKEKRRRRKHKSRKHQQEDAGAEAAAE